MSSAKVVFTDRWLRSLKPLKPGDPVYRKYRWDAALPHFGIKLGAKVAFYTGIRNPHTGKWVERHHGDYPVTSLADARARSRETSAAITEGRPLPAAGGSSGMTVADMAERYKTEILPSKRTAKACAQMIDREILPVIGGRALDELTEDDCVALLKNIPSPHTARKVLSELRVMFAWASFNRIGGLKENPAAGIAVKELLRGRSYTKSRDRVLLDAELRAVWHGSENAPYPFGPLILALILSGQRLNEIAQARWFEIDEGTGCLVVPAERMKGKAAHALPLTRRLRDLLDGLPRFAAGDFIFSTTYGRRPVSGFSKMKNRLDQAIAAKDDIDDWQIHDLRRTMRTGLSRAGVPPFFAELVIAHTQAGVHATYDRHRYGKEVLQALLKWEELLFDQILVAPPDNVREFRAATAN
jgi:integrase